MAGDAQAKQQWLDKYRSLVGAGAAKTGTARGNDTDLLDPNEADAPASAAPSNDSGPIDPYADDTAAADDPVKEAEAEYDAASKDAASKMMAEHDAEAALGKAQSDLADAQANLREKSEKYYAAQAKAHPPAGIDPNADLPADMLPDCKPEPGKIEGPPEHQLCKTHGHVVNIVSKQIIALDIADYNKRHPVPRPMESDCAPDPGKLPGAPAEIVMCKPHGHVIDTKKKQIIANSGIAYLRAHPGAAGAAKAKPATATTAAPTPAASGTGKAGAVKTGTAAGPGGSAAAPAAAKDKPSFDEMKGEWYLVVEKWNCLTWITLRVDVGPNRILRCSAEWQYDAVPFPPPLVYVEYIFTNGLTDRQVGAPTGTKKVAGADDRYDFSGRITLPADAFPERQPGIAVRCHIIVEGTGADKFEQLTVINLRP